MIASIFFIVMVSYLLAGLLFAFLFLKNGLKKVDAAANVSGWGFRLIIIPGTMVLWPFLLKKWITVKKSDHDKATS
jgi:hypothetical protein